MTFEQEKKQRKKDEERTRIFKNFEYFFTSRTTLNAGIVATCYIKTEILEQAITDLKQGKKENSKIRLFYNFSLFFSKGDEIGNFTKIELSNIGDESLVYIIETALNRRKWEKPYHGDYKKSSLIRDSIENYENQQKQGE